MQQYTPIQHVTHEHEIWVGLVDTSLRSNLRRNYSINIIAQLFSFLFFILLYATEVCLLCLALKCRQKLMFSCVIFRALLSHPVSYDDDDDDDDGWILMMLSLVCLNSGHSLTQPLTPTPTPPLPTSKSSEMWLTWPETVQLLPNNGFWDF